MDVLFFYHLIGNFWTFLAKFRIELKDFPDWESCTGTTPAQCSDAGEARTRGPSVLSQALYHWATALPLAFVK